MLLDILSRWRHLAELILSRSAVADVLLLEALTLAAWKVLPRAVNLISSRDV